MAMDRFLIGPTLDEGLRTDLKAWQIPDEAYAELTNAYIFRGRLKKRIGSLYTGTTATGQLGSRLRVLLNTTNGSGALSGTAPGAKFKIGQQFSIGTEIFTVQALGTPVTMLTTGAGTGTFNTTTGAYAFTGCALTTAVYYYPAEPVMGLTQYEKGTIHNQTAYAFDTQFAYKYSGGSWLRDGTMVLTGANYNFVWSYNWDGVLASSTVLFTTNFNVDATIASPNGDSMYYYDGTNWTAWRPQFITSGTANANMIQTCRIIIPFKDRLLLLNTIESDSAGTVNYEYTNRCRYSQNGSPLNANAFQEPNQTTWLGGGYIDGPTEEDIIGAELIRDRCIVYFERSTWEIGYTGNEAVPFIWQQINTELGSEAQFSSIPFDKFILNVGPNGIQSCNGINVDRIDDKIPDEVFNIRIKNQGMQRVAGVRDYYTEMVYWTYPTDDNANAVTYPNKMFVFNYKNGTWALNDDCITAFGYWEQQTDITWSEIQGTWAKNNQTWSSNVNAAQFRHVIAGNQHGYVTELSRDTSSQVGNLSVTNVTYTAGTQSVSLRVNDHSLAIGDYIKLENFNGSSLSGTDGSGIYQINNATTDKDNIVLNGFNADPGIYTGGGTIARVPAINIVSKEWNPYKQQGRDFQLLKIDFGVEKTTSGQATIDYYPSHTNVVLGSNTLDTSPYTLIPLEASQRLLWHQIFFNGEGDSVQIRIYLSDTQMKDVAIAESDFTLEGLILYTQPTRVR
jgi:hypothetical protein